MYDTLKTLPFLSELVGDEAGVIAKLKDTDFYFSWAPHDTIPLWDQGGDIKGIGEEVEFDIVFDSCPEHIREQLVYHLDLFTPRQIE